MLFPFGQLLLFLLAGALIVGATSALLTRYWHQEQRRTAYLKSLYRQRVLHCFGTQKVLHDHYHELAPGYSENDRWVPTEQDEEDECVRVDNPDCRNVQTATPAQAAEAAVREQFRKILEEEATNCAPMRMATAEEAAACCGK